MCKVTSVAGLAAPLTCNKTVRKAGLGSGLASLLVIFCLQLYVDVGVVGLQQVWVGVVGQASLPSCGYL
jgi:hypothetical protein